MRPVSSVITSAFVGDQDENVQSLVTSGPYSLYLGVRRADMEVLETHKIAVD